MAAIDLVLLTCVTVVCNAAEVADPLVWGVVAEMAELLDDT